MCSTTASPYALWDPGVSNEENLEEQGKFVIGYNHNGDENSQIYG